MKCETDFQKTFGINDYLSGLSGSTPATGTTKKSLTIQALFLFLFAHQREAGNIFHSLTHTISLRYTPYFTLI